MMKRQPVFAWLVLLTTLPLVGCKDSPSVSGVKWEIERQIPGIELERESRIRLGRFAFGILKKIALLAMDEDEEGRDVIRHIRRVDVATYRVRGLPEIEEIDRKFRFEKRLAKNGWEVLVKQREGVEGTWVFYRSQEESIRNLYVVTFDHSELTIVDVAGRLDRVFAAALAEDPDEFLDIVT